MLLSATNSAHAAWPCFENVHDPLRVGFRPDDPEGREPIAILPPHPSVEEHLRQANVVVVVEMGKE